MVRFRLKTDYLTFARDQIRGGLWYKPAWWDAVQKSPPTAFQPRVKKRDIPHISFVEDRLLSEFAARHPTLKRFDDRAVAAHRARVTIGAQFVERQLMHMRNNVSTEAAHGLAASWLVANGPAVLRRADPAIAAAGTIRESAVVSEEAYARVMAKQVEIVREALGGGRKGGAGAGAGAGAIARADVPSSRMFLDDAAIAALERRGDAAAAIGATPASTVAVARGGARGRSSTTAADADTAAAAEEELPQGRSDAAMASAGAGEGSEAGAAADGATAAASSTATAAGRQATASGVHSGAAASGRGSAGALPASRPGAGGVGAASKAAAAAATPSAAAGGGADASVARSAGGGGAAAARGRPPTAGGKAGGSGGSGGNPLR